MRRGTLLKRIMLSGLFYYLAAGVVLHAQFFQIPGEQKYQKVHFELVNNLMIIPLEVNGAQLSFILDTGVSHPILFNLADQDSIQLNNVSEILLRGLGDGEPIKALKSTNNTFRMGAIRNFSQHLFVVLDKEMNFSPTLGMPIHGIIGYDLFRDFVVEINYARQFIKFHDPTSYALKPKKNRVTLPMAVANRRAFIDGEVTVQGETEIPVKLLIDTGSSDAVWLFDDPDLGITLPERNYEDYLGRGLAGNIYGRRTKVDRIRIGGFELFDAKAAFPYMEYFSDAPHLEGRNGSLGAEILRRFNVIFDYRHQQITLSKNGRFSDPFRYNMSGLSLQHSGMRYVVEQIDELQRGSTVDNRTFGDVQILVGNRTQISLVPEIVVSAIRAGSPADEAGMREGDVILAVNGKKVHNYKLQEVLQMINDRPGKRIKVLIERQNQDITFSFILKNMFQEKTPQ